MLAQSIVQGMHITNGGYRTNVISGEMEFSYLEENPDATGADPYVRTWMTKDELAAKEGAETAERVFGAVGNQGTSKAVSRTTPFTPMRNGRLPTTAEGRSCSRSPSSRACTSPTAVTAPT